MLLDIIILPPEELRGKIGKEITRATRGLGFSYIVDNKKFIPHLSLFHLVTNSTGLRQVIDFVTRLALGQKKFIVKNGKFGSPNGKGYLWYGFDLSRELRELQEAVRDNCGPLRTGVLPVRPSRLLTKLEKELRRKYGTSYLFEKPDSKPHFSMAKLEDKDNANSVIDKIKLKQFDFLADTLAVAEIQLDGQVTKIIKTFKLK